MKISPLFFYLDEKILSVQSKNLFATAKALYTALAVLRAGSNALHRSGIFQVHQNEEFPRQLSQCRHTSVMSKTQLPQAAVGILRLARYWGIVP